MKKSFIIGLSVLAVMLLVHFLAYPLPWWAFVIGFSISFVFYFAILAIGLFMVLDELKRATPETKLKIKKLLKKK